MANVRGVNGRDRVWAWCAGALAAVATLGPALGPGSLLNLDLVLLPRIPVPPGIWGLGPELPRRVPYGLALAWASNLVGGPVAGKALLLAAVAAACVGAMRLAAGAPPVARVGAGLLYALSPFLLTRIGVGHLGVVVAFAALPWALPTLLRPADHLPRTLLWGALLGTAGVAGGTLALVVITVGLAADRGRRLAPVAGVAVVAQLPWIVPGIVVALAGVDLNPAGRFATRADGLVGLLGLPVGHGFWRASSQAGGDTTEGVALLGCVVLVLAALGASRLPAAWGRRATGLAALGAALAVVSAVPGLRQVYEAATSLPVLASARESQRWLPLLLVWLAPAAALGAARIGGLLARLTPAACALALAAPALWGVEGRLQPVDVPPGWHAAKVAIDRRPGPVLALPWHQYLDLRVADGRRVLNPMRDYLGGDVLSSSDPELSARRQEEADPREAHVRRTLLPRMTEGRPAADALSRLGVRWVVLLHEVEWRSFAPGLRADPGLRRTVDDVAVELFEVRDWRGPVVTAAGEAMPARSVIAPVARVAGSGPATWHRPAAPGWMRGFEPAEEGPFGTLLLPRGGGLVWFWPAVLVLLAHFITLCASLCAWCACQRKEPSVPSESTAD